MKEGNKNLIFGILWGSMMTLVIIGTILACKEPEIKTEYRLELLNQDSVKIYSESTQQLYVVPVDSIQYILDADNL